MPAETTILIVDDDEAQHYLTNRALQRLDFDSETAAVWDGTEACQWLTDHGRPLLLLLDLRMPLMDGHEVLEQLATGQLGEPPPVCIASSSCRPEDLRLPDRYDFVIAYFEKPPSPQALWDAVSDIPELRRHLTEPDG